MIRSHISLSCTLLLAVLLGGCLKDEENPQGTEVENELAGTLYLADGKPAAGARVKIYQVDHNPDSAEPSALSYSTVTDAAGRYVLDSIVRGEYNILGEKGDLVSYQDSVFVSSSSGTLPSDTLRGPGSITGIVVLQPQDNFNRQSVSVQVLGTNIFVNAANDGRFTLSRLAEGEYTVRIVTTLPEYAPLFVTLRAESGLERELPDTLRIPFTGIPVVAGLKSSYDTAMGIANLSWKSTPYGIFKEYLVYRTRENDLQRTTMLIARVTDTVFQDTLFRRTNEGWAHHGGLEPDAYPALNRPAIRFLYSVRIQSRTQAIGPYFEEAPVVAAFPTLVKSYMDFGFAGTTVQGRTISIRDTLKIIVNYYNRTRTNRLIRWFIDDSSIPTRTLEIFGKSGRDTLSYIAFDREERIRFRVEAGDDAGGQWSESTFVEVVKDAPWVYAGPDTLGRVNSSHKLTATAGQRFGTLLNWAWDIGNKGTFHSVSPGGDTTIVLPSVAGSLECVIRVTDDDGNSALDTVHFRVGKSRLLAPMPTKRGAFALSELGGKIYAIGGTTVRPRVNHESMKTLGIVEAFDPATNTWSKCASMKYSRHSLGTAVIDGKIYAVGGFYSGYFAAMVPEKLPFVEAYDPAKNEWKTIPVPDRAGGIHIFLLGASGDRLHILAPSLSGLFTRVLEYQPSTDTWTDSEFDSGPFPYTYKWPLVYADSRYAVHAGRFYNVPYSDPGTMVEYNSDGRAFRPVQTLKDAVIFPAIATLDNRIYLLGGTGLGSGASIDLVESYNPTQGFSVETKVPIYLRRHNASAIGHSGKLFVIGGFLSDAVPLDLVEEYEP